MSGEERKLESFKVLELTQLQAVYLVSMLQSNGIEAFYYENSEDAVRAEDPGDDQGFAWAKGLMTGFREGVRYCREVKEEANKL